MPWPESQTSDLGSSTPFVSVRKHPSSSPSAPLRKFPSAPHQGRDGELEEMICHPPLGH